MPNTTNYNWATPADSDLVKDGAAAIRTLGNSIDTSFVDLKGGTTGQVLAKNSNTDLDFVWSSDQVGIPASIVDAKGDIIAATAADTVSRLAVGANDTVLTADSTSATGLKWATPAAGGMTLLSTTTFTGSSISLTSIPSTYIDLVLIITQVTGTTDGADFRIQFNSDTGANYGIQNGTTLQDGLTQIGLGSLMTTSTSPYKKLQGRILIPRYSNSDYKFVPINLSASSASTDLYLSRQGLYASTNAISSIQLKPSAGTFSGGTVYLYGVK